MRWALVLAGRVGWFSRPRRVDSGQATAALYSQLASAARAGITCCSVPLTVAGLVDAVPRTGCGTADGDCRPAARLHALRQVASARGESVSAVVSRETRISAAGAWSLPTP